MLCHITAKPGPSTNPPTTNSWGVKCTDASHSNALRRPWRKLHRRKRRYRGISILFDGIERDDSNVDRNSRTTAVEILQHEQRRCYNGTKTHDELHRKSIHLIGVGKEAIRKKCKKPCSVFFISMPYYTFIVH